MRVEKRSLSTVTYALIVTSAPVPKVSGLVASPEQFDEMTRVEVTSTPPLHSAQAEAVGRTETIGRR